MKTILQTPAPNMDNSVAFYQSLDFDIIDQNQEDTYVTDGKIIIHLNGRPQGRLSLEVYHEDLKSMVEPLSRYLHVKDGDQYIIQDPNGVRVHLLSLRDIPNGLDSDIADVKPLCGVNYGVGIETPDMEKTYAFWRNFGYNVSHGNLKEDGFVGLSNSTSTDMSLFRIGSCPHMFINLSLTYFNGKKGNLEVIEKMRSRNVRMVEEITLFNPEGKVDNVIISDPGGLHMFIFNDGSD